MNWILIALGAAIFQLAGIAQVFHRRIQQRWFFMFEVAAAGLGAYAIAAGVTEEYVYAAGFAVVWAVMTAIILALVLRVVTAQSK